MPPLRPSCIGLIIAAICCAQTKSDPSRPDASRGNETFDEQCSSCHYADKDERKVGPGLKWLYSKGALESNGKPVTDANVLDKIDKGGKGMPAYRDTLSKEDKINLLAYLKTL